tara:strand:- start:424 stop:735 length:312 start_codon:yes stop_codon:yes gene_type:complete
MDLIKQVEKHYNVKFVDEWVDDCNFYIYEESTADGYSVYIAVKHPNYIGVNENVHYYDNDLPIALIEEVVEVECKKVYIDDLEQYWVIEAFEELLKKLNDEEY